MIEIVIDSHSETSFIDLRRGLSFEISSEWGS
jgi:hypothetical protein